MQEFWVKPGEQYQVTSGILKVLKTDEKKGIRVRLIEQQQIEEVRKIRGPVVEPIRPKLKALVD